MRTFVRFALAAPLIACVLGVGGCGSKVPLHPVSGKVTVGDTALTSGVVTFVPDESKGNKSKTSPSGPIGSDGNYTLSTDGRSGAPAGWYKVIVLTDTPGMGGANPVDTTPGKVAPLGGQGSKIDPKYKDATRTDLTKEVVTSASPGHYDLKIPR
jgi:hypothetical protein